MELHNPNNDPTEESMGPMDNGMSKLFMVKDGTFS